jgi:very-short-patch-repair endonuclease
VDFACTAARLVVEIDGASHHGRERHDAARDRALLGLGWSVLRVPEHRVFADLDCVVQQIAQAAHLALAARLSHA